MNHRAWSRCTALAILLLTTPLRAQHTTGPAHDNTDRSTATWLVDSARDYGHARAGQPSQSDAQIVLALMRAAARIDPKDPEPHRWQADILEALGQNEQALNALGEYVKLDTRDVTAKLEWIARSVERRQTIEERQRFVAEQLKRATGQPLVAADAHRRLAEIALTRFDRPAARKHIQAALELALYDPAVNRLAYAIFDDAGQRPDRIAAALRLIAANPLDVDVVWQLGRLLDDLSLHRQAQTWYTYALDVFRTANPDTQPPVEYLFDLARSHVDGGDPQSALEGCGECLRADPTYVRPRLLMIHVLRKLGHGERALAQIRDVGQHYAKHHKRVVETREPRLATEMAWFYALYDPQPDQAMRFAKIAMDQPTPSESARRAYGFAALAKKDMPRAENALKDLAPTDQMAAVGLARVYLASKRAHLIVPLLQRAAEIRATGVAHDEIAKLLEDNGLAVPPVPDHPEIRKRLDRFDRTPLQYYKHPDKFLRITARFVKPTLTPTDPWAVSFELTNTGPFVITLGRGMMVSPDLILSAVSAGDRDRQFPDFLLITLDRTPILQPGQSVATVQTVDIGPLRKVMTTTPQVTQAVRLRGILDPRQTPDGRWTRRFCGLDMPPAEANRPAVDASPKAIAAYQDALMADRPAQAVQAAAVLSALLAEELARKKGKLEHKARPLDADTVLDHLLRATARTDGDPIIRARLIESFRRLELTSPVVKGLAPALSDPHWLVRLITTWLFAQKQGPPFAKVVQKTATHDPDPLVRTFAAAYLEKLQQPPPNR